MSSAQQLVPAWVEPGVLEPGSTDPLGFRAKRDELAEVILPGITVNTWEPGYVSFLCWAIQQSDAEPRTIDAWERALVVSEWFRHRDDEAAHPYLGSRIVQSIDLAPGARLPAAMHRQTARILYASLLRSFGFLSAEGELTPIGARLAGLYRRRVRGLRKPPRTVARARELPCVTELRRPECALIERQLFTGAHGERRRAFYDRLRKLAPWALRQGRFDSRRLLPKFLRLPAHADGLDGTLRRIAILELEALPLEQLFQWLYREGGPPRGRRRVVRGGRLFHVRTETFDELLGDVLRHLRVLRRCKADMAWPDRLDELRSELYRRHMSRKGAGAWVDASWRQLRRGLGSENADPSGYRIAAFISFYRGLRR